MLNKKLFSIATSLLLFSSFGMAEEEEKGFRSGLARAGCSTVDGVYTCSGTTELVGFNYNNAAKDPKELVIKDIINRPGDSSRQIWFHGINLNSEQKDYDGFSVTLDKVISGSEGGSANNLELKLIDNGKKETENLSNMNVNIIDSTAYGRTQGVRFQVVAGGDQARDFSLNNLTMNVKDSNFIYKSNNVGESALLAAHMDEAKSEKSNFFAKDITLNLDNVKVYGKAESSDEEIGVPGSVTGLLVGKNDEHKTSKTTSGNIKAENIIVKINDSSISGAVKGVEAAAFGSVDANGQIFLTDSKVGGGVIGSLVGTMSATVKPSDIETLDKAYNLREHYSKIILAMADAKASGSVILDKSTVENYLYGSAALNQNEAYSESSVSLKNGSTIAKDAYGAYAVSKNENATSLGALSLASNSIIQGDAYGAYLSTSKNAKAEANINIVDSEVLGNLYGNFIDNPDNKEVSNLEANSIFFMDKATINGKIAGNTMGNVAGDVNATGQFTLKNSNNLKGDIYANQIGNVGGEVINASALLSLENSKANANLYGNSIGNIGKDANLSSSIFLNSSEVAGDIYGNYIKEFGNEDEEAKVVSNITLKNNAHLEKDLTANYFGKVNGHINSEANIILDNANINGHIYGNFLDNFDENDQKGGNAVLKSELTLTNNVNIVGDIYGNYVKDAKGDVKAESIITLNEANGKDEGTIYGNYIENAKNVDVSSSIIVKEGKDKDIDSHIYGNYIVNASGDIKTDNFIHLEGDGFHGEIIGTYIEGSANANLNLNNVFNIINDTAESNIEFGTIAGHRHDKTKGIMAYNDKFTKASSNIKNTLVLNNTQITVGTLENINEFDIKLGGDRDLNGLFYSVLEYENPHDSVIKVTGNIIYDDGVLGNAQAIIGGFNEDQVLPGGILDVLKVEGQILQNGKEITMAELFKNQESGQIDIGFTEVGYTNWLINPETGELAVVISGTPDTEVPILSYCENPANKNKPACLAIEPPPPLDFCEYEENKNHPDCIDEPEEKDIDCKDPANKDNPQCKPIEPPVNCEKNPNHPACAFQVSQERLAKASSIYQARLASMATINKGADLVVNTITLNLEPTKLGDLIPFC